MIQDLMNLCVFPTKDWLNIGIVVMWGGFAVIEAIPNTTIFK